MAQTVDPKAYYAYLFQSNKQPTKVLDALLRGIAHYIVDFVGSPDDKTLSPAKLAGFYKAVGGNYDSLFVDVPHSSISWIYASIGCQHTLQPTSNAFDPPSIPALTTQGFVTWQSIEILLGPEEHVPFIQNAVRDFAIKNPDTGEPFPIEVPKEAFPLTTDVDIEKWHSQCAKKLKRIATPDPTDDINSRPDLPPRPKVQTGYAHIRVAPSERPKSDYFNPRLRPISKPIPYQHISSNGRPVRPGLAQSASVRTRQFLAPEMEGNSPDSPRLTRSRRRSFPENMNSSPISSPLGEPSPDLRPEAPKGARPHSHPRPARRGSVSSDASSEREEPPSPDAPKRRSQPYARGGSRPSIRLDYPSPVSSPQAAHAVSTPPDPRRSRISREHGDDAKRASYSIPIDLNGKLSEPFLMSQRNPRSNSRSENNVRWQDLSDVSSMWRKGPNKSSEEERDAGRRDAPSSRRHSRDLDREVDRDSGGGGGPQKRRERERDREPLSSRPRTSGHSSHEEDSRRERDWDRERDGIGHGEGRGDGRSFRERARERRPDSPPARGVDGRYYPVR